ncbi:hypothetical protein PV797_17465 [Clostridiaceae bacterium M8S5]|nr:hypothetical protein PV797_17465 [Clostridiaceae bacterium M8S5]
MRTGNVILSFDKNSSIGQVNMVMLAFNNNAKIKYKVTTNVY